MFYVIIYTLVISYFKLLLKIHRNNIKKEIYFIALLIKSSRLKFFLLLNMYI